jgi:hypothetical protein
MSCWGDCPETEKPVAAVIWELVLGERAHSFENRHQKPPGGGFVSPLSLEGLIAVDEESYEEGTLIVPARVLPIPERTDMGPDRAVGSEQVPWSGMETGRIAGVYTSNSVTRRECLQHGLVQDRPCKDLIPVFPWTMVLHGLSWSSRSG